MAGDSGGARWWSGHKVIETSGSRGLGLLESIVGELCSRDCLLGGDYTDKFPIVY